MEVKASEYYLNLYQFNNEEFQKRKKKLDLDGMMIFYKQKVANDDFNTYVIMKNHLILFYDNKIFKKQLIDLKKYSDKYEDEEDKLFFLGHMLQPDNYDLFQIANLI